MAIRTPRALNEDEEHQQQSLRPQGFSTYLGQESVKENLQIACQAATVRGDALDHILLHGPPGLGKTSLARILATEMRVGFKATSGPVIEKPGDLAAILSSLEERDLLFIDEIHRLPRVVEEVLYPAMEDFEIDILIGQGPSAKSVRIDLKPFTLVGATTRTGLLTSPLRDRFGISLRLSFYNPEELAHIVIRSANILEIPIDNAAAQLIGSRSRGTPRIANRLLKRVRDYVQYRQEERITEHLTEEALARLHVDAHGLDDMDRMILTTIVDKFSGGPVGIDTIAAALGEERGTLEDVYEPYLLQSGFIARTKRGREVTALGYEHLNRVPPKTGRNVELFS
ncbi:MAG: Holliday junction branch migration DNA helicase RuvB [Bdellovibrionales bacterium]|nr:Holliday junction branch migration DNA helicase RuvB [Bdellovibrionales bacterium]